MCQMDYDKTLNLPKTDFPMRGGLTVKEPEMLKKWDETGLYEKLMKKNSDKPLWVLHDGPPYANGEIHIGTAMNKILKDFIVRYRNMTGWKSPYVPGWDTHGLPIELKAREKAGISNAMAMPPQELRKICEEFALSFVDNQRTQFKRLGVIGDWDNPYLTLKPEFVKEQINVFGALATKGYIYKGLKPVYWCSECETALAEAEIEYQEDVAFSVYIKFAVNDDKGILHDKGIDAAKTSFLIWTTTTWTIPANSAIALGPEYVYDVVKYGDEYLIMAQQLKESVFEATKKNDIPHETVASFKGSELEYMTAQHPFLDRDSLVIVGNHVTLESGTGCVHTAPGHGVDDYNVSLKYENVPIIVPVDDKGIMTEEAGEICAGMTTSDAGRALAMHMTKTGALFYSGRMTHQYPHCWRCKEPILFRATEQWFCSIEQLKKQATKAAEDITWYPSWGKDRMISMVNERSDWCISRQRTWGVPIPIFYCTDCEKPIIEADFISAVADIFGKEGANAWYIRSADEILPKGAKCPHCGGLHFTKETDIMDVWFDSGSSHAAVLAKRDDLKWPADLYLEGGDQFRGWFQSSLLTAIAWRDAAPYKAVVTHGWTVDGEGKKMSKSIGNTVDPSEITEKNGADILRLWVASLDYQADARFSQDILKQQSESYRKIRNTARFILGNLKDFDPNIHMVSEDKFEEVDKWALMRLEQLTDQVIKAYEGYVFHDALHAIHNFCVVDMSNFYLDILKDRLYVEKTESDTRRAAQTVIYKQLSAITRMLAPMLAFTAEEIWSYLPHLDSEDAESVMFNDIDKADLSRVDENLMYKWRKIHDLRDDVKKALETARAAKQIGDSLEAKVVLSCTGELFDFVSEVASVLPSVFIVSGTEVVNRSETTDGKSETGESLGIEIKSADGEKCVRCWTYDTTVGSDAKHSKICDRCISVVE